MSWVNLELSVGFLRINIGNYDDSQSRSEYWISGLYSQKLRCAEKDLFLMVLQELWLKYKNRLNFSSFIYDLKVGYHPGQRGGKIRKYRSILFRFPWDTLYY